MNANNRRRKDFHTLPLADKELLQSLGYTDRISAVDHAISVNAEFLNHVIASPEIFSGQDGDEEEDDPELKGNDQEDSDDNRGEGSSSTPCAIDFIVAEHGTYDLHQPMPLAIRILTRMGLILIRIPTNTMLQVLLV